jgi:uncharacterized FAD-dependent dehydrogenase
MGVVKRLGGWTLWGDTMIRVNQLKLPITHTQEELMKKLAKRLQVPKEMVQEYTIVRKSIDARKKEAVLFVYTIDVKLLQKPGQRYKVNHNNITSTKVIRYQIPKSGNHALSASPVIIGSGPAGLFCALLLAEQGYRPILLERGKAVEERQQDVEHFWQHGMLLADSNLQFGEGGAGTFSDGKLNTLIKDEFGRGKKILETFVKYGAPEEICYDAKPHLGTDMLLKILKAIRKQILYLGGSYHFETCVTHFAIEEHSLLGSKIHGVHCISGKNKTSQFIRTDTVILAIGHSARDTFHTLHQQGVVMAAKPFAVGLRIEHPQAQISRQQYGAKAMEQLAPAPYKLAARSSDKRGVYSFCMCPGGYVVNASSHSNHLVVNGMSYSKRDSSNANSAIVVTVTDADFPDQGIFGGVHLQEQLEKKSWSLANGSIPQQLLGDYMNKENSFSYGEFESCVKGKAAFAPLHELLPPAIKQSIMEGIQYFSRQITNFDRADSILSGVESRTSSPIRIIRNEQFESNVSGIYPCGEGAGYAGGILSAAIDGLKVAEAIIKQYQPII